MTSIPITNSLIKQYKSCQQATQFKYVENLGPRMMKSKPLKRGIWFHELLEARYKGESVKEAHQRNIVLFNDLYDEEKEAVGADLPQEMADLYNSYRWYYRNDRGWKVHEVETKVEAELPNGLMGQGKADMLIEDEYGLWLVDHKTHLTLPTWDYRLLDPQAPYYIWLFRKNGIPVRGFIWNYVVPKGPKPLKFKMNGYLSKVRPAITDYPTASKEWPKEIHPYLHAEVRDCLSTLEKVRYQRDTPQLSTVFRRDVHEPTEEAIQTVVNDFCVSGQRFTQWRRDMLQFHEAWGHFPIVERTVSRQCEWCEYRNLCVAEMNGMHADGIRKREFVTADPFEYYKESNDEATGKV